MGVLLLERHRLLEHLLLELLRGHRHVALELRLQHVLLGLVLVREHVRLELVLVRQRAGRILLLGLDHAHVKVPSRGKCMIRNELQPPALPGQSIYVQLPIIR